MRTSLEVINRSAILLHLPEEYGNSVKVILGGADGPLVTIDANGHIHVAPSKRRPLAPDDQSAERF